MSTEGMLPTLIAVNHRLDILSVQDASTSRGCLGARLRVTDQVTVLGGGPAGSGAAKLLSQWGHAVRLITRPASDSRLAVSIPPSCHKLFVAIGIDDAIKRAGFVRTTGNTVWWGQPQPRVEMFAAGGRGWQVSLQALEDVMLAEAAAAMFERFEVAPSS